MNNYLPANLKYLRKKSGKSQSDIALQINKKNTAVSSWENELSEPSLGDLRILSDYFAIHIGDLIGKDLTNEVTVQTSIIKNIEERKDFDEGSKEIILRLSKTIESQNQIIKELTIANKTKAISA